MRRFTLSLLMLFALTAFCQTDNNTLSNKLVSVSFEEQPMPVKRKLLTFKKRASYFNPLNYIGAGMLYVYQNIFSEQIQASCAYQISCSEYTTLSIQKYGFFIGTLKGFNQLSECSPTAQYEHPPLYTNNEGKIINAFEKETK